MVYLKGAHLNPAVSFSMLLIRQMTVWKFIVYIVAQSIGALLAPLMVYVIYLDQLKKKFGDRVYTVDTASIFATYPNDLESPNILSNFLDQFFATALFIICILAVTDRRNNLQQPFVALFIGLTLLVIGTSYGYNSGFALNPARDFWPRVFTSIAGWGSVPFTSGFHFFWIPILGPMVGSLAGTVFYCLFISNHHEDEFQLY